MPADIPLALKSHPFAAIRRAVSADVASLVHLEQAVFEMEQLTARSFRRYIAHERADVIVAERPDGIVAYGITAHRAGSAQSRLISLATATRATARGIGTLLLETLHELASLRGMTRMSLEVRRDNAAALSLYERLGYRMIGEKPDYYADFCDALVLQRSL